MPLAKPEKLTDSQYDALLPLVMIKEWAKVQHGLEDGLLGRIRNGVILQCEKYTGKLFIRRTVHWQTPYYYTGYPLPYGGDADLVVQRFDGTELVDVTLPIERQTGEMGLVYQARHNALPDGQYYQLRYTAGIESTDEEDLWDFYNAAQQMVTSFFAHRKNFETGTIVVEIPLSAKSILNGYIDTPMLY